MRESCRAGYARYRHPGIYGSALDQACIDLIYEQKDGDGASLVNRIESRNGLHTLEHAEEIGLGSRTYQLVNIDD